jgi:hypothetical protein
MIGLGLQQRAIYQLVDADISPNYIKINYDGESIHRDSNPLIWSTALEERGH